MNLRHRITLQVLLTFVAITAIGGYSILQSRDNASEVRQVTENVVPSALASADLVALLKDVQLATMTLVSAPDDSVATQASNKLATQKSLLKSQLDQQFRQASNPTQQGLLSQARETLDDYFAAIDDTTQFKLAGQTELAEASLFASVAQYQREMGQIIDTLRIEKNRTKDSAVATLNRNLSNALVTISLASVLAALALAVAGILLYRQIARPISRMQQMMSEIAASQDFTRRLPVERDDEIGQSIAAFNSMIAKIEQGSALLKQKTCDIQTMLQNIPQGILTVTEGNRIHPEYSAYLETILGTRHIAGRKLMEVVFSGSTLGHDTLAQIQTVAEACIGEDMMNFAFNEHLLVGEIEKVMADGRTKVLDLNWSPIEDETGTIQRLLLCVRDVTELRRLAAEAGEQKRELEIIGEILSVAQEKFHEFIIGAIGFIDENEVLIRRHPEGNADTVAQLFRNMHTIKGNARTYGLRHLTDLVHTAEQTYSELRKTRPDLAWDQDMLLGELETVRDMVERYARINEVSLGRKGPGRRGNAGQYLMVDREHIQRAILRLEKINTSNLHELVAGRDAVRKTLRLLGTETITEILSGVLESLPELSRELTKEAPTVKIEDGGLRIRSQAGSLLKNVFMHLIRNAMDHGLEGTELRLATGKPAAGTIRIQVGIADRMLQVRLSDDGRGLALARIRQIAADKGLIIPDQSLSDAQTAQLIFQPGFSTADKLTKISGRGVGMDAVNDFIRRENGKIEIRFTAGAEGESFRPFETVISLPESLAEQVESRGASASEHFRPQSDEAPATDAATNETELV